MQFLIIDDHTLIVQAMSLLLKTKFPEAVIHTGSTADDARALVEQYGAETDLLILDLNIPGVTSATSLLQELVQTDETMKILVLSGIVDQHNIMRVLQLGAAGFVPKSLDPEMLTNAIDFVLKGGVFIPTKLLSESQKAGLLTEAAVEIAQGSSNSEIRLTQRQTDVLMTLARGLPIKRICRELGLSEGTVKTHVAAIYRAFGATNRTEALIAARRAGFDISL
ncbi:MAG: response regulator transcription factor [Duodenibacillus sp.]|nr:response regulator transcription factor [Duodenibacillus sp.]